MKPKMFFLLVILCFMLGSSTDAQEVPLGQNELRGGYGFITGPEMANSLFSIWPAIGMTIRKDTIADYMCSFIGVADLEYNRFLGKRVSIGVSVSLNPVSTLLKTKHGKELTWNYYIINVMPKINFYYVNKGILSLYSGVETGAALILWKDRLGSSTLTDTGVSWAFHVNAFGIRVGKGIGAYMEWGFGFRGVINFGISGRF